MSDLLQAAHKVVDLALKQGARQARATAYKNQDIQLECRGGRVDKVSEATTFGVSFQLYVDGRYVALATSDLRPSALAAFVSDSMQMARAIAADPFRALPNRALYDGRSRADLDLVDPALAAFDATSCRRIANELEAAARSAKGADAIVSVTASVSTGHRETATVASNGFEGEHAEAEVGISCDVSVNDPDGRRPENGLSATVRHRSDLPLPAEFGAASTARALAAIGARKAESKVMTMVVENRAARRLVTGLLGALTARSLQQKQSFLDGKLGAQIASKHFTCIDDPLLPRGLGSRHFDDEGIRAAKFAVVENGVLKSFYVDDYYGRKLKLAPTTGSPSNLIFPGGKADLEQLVRDVKDGVLVTSFLGGNTNSTTGDYSFGVQGVRLRNGIRSEAIAETNISGNLLSLFQQLSAVGNDPYLYSPVRSPTLVFDAVQFAGA